MDPLTVFIIAIVTFAVFVLLTAYALKMAVIMGKETRKARLNADSKKNKSTTAEEDDDDISE